MEFLERYRPWTYAVGAVLALGILYLGWWWFVERTEVPPEHILIVTNRWGSPLPEGQILATEPDMQGIQRDVKGEGRYFLNPFFSGREVRKMTIVPAGKCLVRIRKAGTEISANRLARGEYLAGEGERGIVPGVLVPGRYPINPHEYDTQLIDAVVIKAQQVGVRVRKWGKDPSELKLAEKPGKGLRTSPYVVPDGYRGVQEKAVPPGDYYINPFVESVTPVDIRTHRVEFRDIEFPSADGFQIRPRVFVAYKVIPEKAPELYVLLCEAGVLHQEDTTEAQLRKNETLQTIVLPLIRGYVRIEGSRYNASDYISQQSDPGKPRVNPRERLQKELMTKVAPLCRRAGVQIDSIAVSEPAQTEEMKELAAQIYERERLRAVREKNEELIAQYKQDKDRRAKELLTGREQALAEAQRGLEVATTRADQDKKVEKAKLDQELKAAGVRLEAAHNQAKQTLTKARADTSVINAENEAQVAGLRKAIDGFSSPEQFASYHMINRLAPALAEIFASDTSDFARLFSAYMSPARRGAPAGAPMGAKLPAAPPPSGPGRPTSR